MTPPPLADAGRLELLTTLVYELLDAHRDTMELAAPLAGLDWRAHLDYVRGLQRTGRELLALAHQPGLSARPWLET